MSLIWPPFHKLELKLDAYLENWGTIVVMSTAVIEAAYAHKFNPGSFLWRRMGTIALKL